MRHCEHQQADQLETYWTAVRQDAAAQPPAALDAETAALVRWLVQQRHRLEPEDTFMATLGHRLATQAGTLRRQPVQEPGAPALRWGADQARWFRRPTWMRRPLVAVLAIVLALGSVTTSLHSVTPTSVSAQVIVQRAAAVAAQPAAPPDALIHQVSTVSTVLKLNVTPLQTTIDQWMQLDAQGNLVQRVATIRSQAGSLVARFLDREGTEQIYDAMGNTIFTTTLRPGATSPWTHDPSGMAAARQLLTAGQTSAGSPRLLPRQTLNGVTVDAVSFDNVLPSSAPAAAGFLPQRLTTTLYIDAQTYAIRGMDLNESAAGVSAPVVTLRVTGYETVPLSAVSATTFALDAPANAQVWHSLPAREVAQHTVATAVAQAVAVPDQPALLLSGDVAGLRFHGVGSVVQSDGTTITSYGYGPPVRVADEGDGPVDPADGIGSPSPRARSLTIQVNHAAARDSAGRVPGEFTSRGAQPLTVTIAGQTVRAAYWALETPTPALHELSYHQGTSWIMISSQGLSKAEFFAAITALVDARAHPEVVAQAQYERDVWDYETRATLGAIAGLCPACHP